MPTLSVITLTRNRLAKVELCRERLLPQLGPGDEWLLLDTGSDDGTRERFAEPGQAAIRLLTFDRAGSWAEMRNYAVAQARGEWIAFLDDDCLPARDWVARGKRGLAEADAVGGIAQPLGLASFPKWWHPEMGWMVGLGVPGQVGPDAGRIHYPTTSNLWAWAAVCRAVPFQELGGELGGEESARYRTGREDAQWWRHLRVEGFRTRFDAYLVAGHAIDPARLDLAYLRRRAGLDGRAWALRDGTRQDIAPLAYQWWRQFFAAWGALTAAHHSRTCHWRYHHLTRHRHGQALKGLEEKFYDAPMQTPLRWLKPWYAAALGRLAYDQAKTAARCLLRPLLISRPLRPTAPRIERLAVIAFGYLGDLVILQSALRGLTQAHPQVELYVLAPPAATAVLKEIKRLNLTLTPELKPTSRAAREWIADWLTRLDPDAIVAPYLHEPWGRTLLALRRPPRPILGFDSDQGLGRLRHLERLGVKVHKNLQLHEGLNLCALFGAAGLRCELVPAEIRPDADRLAHLRENSWLAAHFNGGTLSGGTPLVMFNPDAGHPQKEWSDAQWASLAHLILEQTDWLIVINQVRTHPLLEEVCRPNDRATRLFKTPLPELFAWLAVCNALVTVDSGPQHLAHALGVPSLTLYGPMDERRWADALHRPMHQTLRACTPDLTPEEKRGLAVNHEVLRIQPDVVFDKLKSLVSCCRSHDAD